MTTEGAQNTNNNNSNSNISEMLPIRLQSTVVHGFGRGSSDLGIPTANLDRDHCVAKSVPLQTSPNFADLPTGIYWGFGRIGGGTGTGAQGESSSSLTTDHKVYTAAISIGYNPTYGNQEKTVEPHFIASQDDPRRHTSSCGETLLPDFYNQPIRLTVVEYLRPELPFEGLEKLIAAIKQDIVHAEDKAAHQDSVAQQEKQWVASEQSP